MSMLKQNPLENHNIFYMRLSAMAFDDRAIQKDKTNAKPVVDFRNRIIVVKRLCLA
jgi:hypothetical protein